MANPQVPSSVSMSMAVLLIASSIALALYLGFEDHDIETGVRWYIAQAFMLAGSLFGLDYYVKKIKQL